MHSDLPIGLYDNVMMAKMKEYERNTNVFLLTDRIFKATHSKKRSVNSQITKFEHQTLEVL